VTLFGFAFANVYSGFVRSTDPWGFPRYGFPFDVMESAGMLFDTHIDQGMFLVDVATAVLISGVIGFLFWRLASKDYAS
jgi:hypothetical protein